MNVDIGKRPVQANTKPYQLSKIVSIMVAQFFIRFHNFHTIQFRSRFPATLTFIIKLMIYYHITINAIISLMEIENIKQCVHLIESYYF